MGNSFRGFILVLAASVLGLVMTTPVAAAKRPAPAVQWIDLSGTAKQHPRFIYFTANSGSQVHSIKWTGWGKGRTIGRGTYRITSPPPPGGKNPHGPARIVAWKPISCVPEFGNRKDRKISVYRHAKMLRPVPEGGRKWVNISAWTGYLSCKRLSSQAK